MPLCSKCSLVHHNFQSCAQGAASAEAASRTPDKFLRPRDETKDFGNSFHTLQGRESGNTIVSFIPRGDHPRFIPLKPPEAA